MAIILGSRQLIDIAIPTGIDAAALMRFAMQEGMTPNEVIALAATLIGEANQHLIDMFGGLIYLTEKMSSQYRNGGTTGATPVAAEFKEEDGQVTEQIGHMLLMKDFKDATGWSQDYLESAVREDILNDLILKKERWINRIEIDVFTCMFRATEILIGTAGYAVPWAIGTGMNVNFIPPQWSGIDFNSSHTHFIRINAVASSSNVPTTIETMAEELAHHGHIELKVCYVGSAIADILLALNSQKWATYVAPEFRLLSGNSNAPVAYVSGQLQGVPGEIIGYYSTPKGGLVEVRRHHRVPANYLWMGKSYGNNNQKNPMAIRTRPGKGFGLMVRPQLSRDVEPTLEKVLFKGTHGVNVNDRTAGVAAQIASGGTTYNTPTIS